MPVELLAIFLLAIFVWVRVGVWGLACRDARRRAPETPEAYAKVPRAPKRAARGPPGERLPIGLEHLLEPVDTRVGPRIALGPRAARL